MNTLEGKLHKSKAPKLAAVKRAWTWRVVEIGNARESAGTYLNHTYILHDTASELRAAFNFQPGDTLLASNRYMRGAIAFFHDEADEFSYDPPRWISLGGIVLTFCSRGIKRIFKGQPPVIYIKRVVK